MTGVGAAVGAVGAAIVTPFLGAAKVFADMGSELNDMSARTGLSVESLSALGFAANQTGTDLGAVEIGVRKMQKALVAGSEENQTAVKTFASLGLSVQALAKLSPEQQFQAIAGAISRIKDPTQKAGAALQIFGKSGTALLPMIDDMDALTKTAKDLGLVMSTKDATAADNLGDAMDTVSAQMKQVAFTVGAAVAPMLLDLAGTMTRLIKTGLDWVNANRPLVATIFQVGAAVVAIGGAIVGLGAILSGAGVVLGGVVTGIGVVGTILGAILSPIGLVVAGLAGLATWFFTSTEAGAQALGFLSGVFAGLLADATAAFGGIANALKAGDIALAAQILWAALKVEWIKGVNFLSAVWADWGIAATEVFRGFSFAIASLMTDAWAGVQVIWATVLADLEGSWGSLIERMIKAFLPLVDIIAKAFGVDIQKTIDDALQAVGVGAGGDAAKAAREKGLNDKLGGIETERVAAQQGLTDQQQAEKDARRAVAQEGLAGGADELAKAQAELDALNATAGQEAAGLSGAAEGAKKAPLTPEGLDQALTGTKSKVDVTGTFGASRLQGLGAGTSVTDEIKAHKKETEKSNKLLEKVANSKAVFANA